MGKKGDDALPIFIVGRAQDDAISFFFAHEIEYTLRGCFFL
jgi:hypothetical protein